jgi:hypothetical protein
MHQLANKLWTVVLALALVAAPVLLIILAIEGDWGPAAAVGVAFAGSWWRGKRSGVFMPAALTRKRERRERRERYGQARHGREQPRLR